jgi:hypothetical protein
MKTISTLFLALGLSVSAIFTQSCSARKDLVVTQVPDRPAYQRNPSPGPGYTWVEGDWTVRNNTYHWNKGHWAKSKDKVWVAGDWVYRNNGWSWSRGYWIDANSDYARNR